MHTVVNPLNAELNPIWHLLALLGAHHILHVSRIRVKLQLFLDYVDTKLGLLHYFIIYVAMLFVSRLYSVNSW
jgi:hypothetical protein